MGPLLKRAGGPAVVEKMAPEDVLQQADVIIECGCDGELAGLLAERIVKAVSSGEWSFPRGKLQALVSLAATFKKGVPATTDGQEALRKAVRDVRHASAEVLAPDFAARFHVVANIAKVATTDHERELAKRQVDGLAADIRQHDAFKKAFATPKTFGACPS